MKIVLHVLRKDAHFQVRAFVFMVTTVAAQLIARDHLSFSRVQIKRHRFNNFY